MTLAIRLKALALNLFSYSLIALALVVLYYIFARRRIMYKYKYKGTKFSVALVHIATSWIVLMVIGWRFIRANTVVDAPLPPYLDKSVLLAHALFLTVAMPTGMGLIQFAKYDGPIIYYSLFFIYAIYLQNSLSAVLTYKATHTFHQELCRQTLILLAAQPFSRVLTHYCVKVGYDRKGAMGISNAVVVILGYGVKYGEIGALMSGVGLLVILAIDPAGFIKMRDVKRAMVKMQEQANEMKKNVQRRLSVAVAPTVEYAKGRISEVVRPTMEYAAGRVSDVARPAMEYGRRLSGVIAPTMEYGRRLSGVIAPGVEYGKDFGTNMKRRLSGVVAPLIIPARHGSQTDAPESPTSHRDSGSIRYRRPTLRSPLKPLLSDVSMHFDEPEDHESPTTLVNTPVNQNENLSKPVSLNKAVNFTINKPALDKPANGGGGIKKPLRRRAMSEVVRPATTGSW